jgi:hypothetical protein
MSIHFENRTAAEADLKAHGFRKLRSGNWFKAGDEIAAHILTRHDEIVLVQYWQA